jgi:hypothetical protein
MSYVTLRTPIPARDSMGRDVLRVPLANVPAHAVILAEDYHDLIARGVSPNWSWVEGAVKVGHRPYGTIRVARLILNAPSGFAVRHRDACALDLRRETLVLVPIRRHPKASFTPVTL